MIKTLIIEDSTAFRTAFRDALTRRMSSLVVAEAANGEEALTRLADFRPDIVFLDIRLPGKTGLELIGPVKAGFPGAAVIILTDYDLPEYRDAARQGGADDFISKSALNIAAIADLMRRLTADRETGHETAGA